MDSLQGSKCSARINTSTTLQQLAALEQEFYIRFDHVPEPIHIDNCLEYTFYLHEIDFDNFINCIERFNDEFNCPQIDYSIDGN